MEKNKQHNNMQQLILEEYQDRPVTIIKIEVAEPDTDPDMGTLPGCIGIYNQPEQGYECSTCYHQQLCKETTPTVTVVENKKVRHHIKKVNKT